MKIKNLFLLASLAMVMPTTAQTPQEDFKRDITLSGSNCGLSWPAEGTDSCAQGIQTLLSEPLWPTWLPLYDWQGGLRRALLCSAEGEAGGQAHCQGRRDTGKGEIASRGGKRTRRRADSARSNSAPGDNQANDGKIS